MWDFVIDKSGAGPGFLQELWFPLPIYIPSDICFSTIIFTINQGWYNRPGVAAVPIASPKKKNRWSRCHGVIISYIKMYMFSLLSCEIKKN
jgi:hypothetical protein